MKWVLIIFLLISCADNSDEEMRLFISGLNAEGTITPPPTILDGGELVALVPDLPLGQPTYGYTNTGLFYCKAESEARTDGKLVFWSSNWGRKDSGTAGGRFESIVKILIDYQIGGGLVGDRYTAELVENINTYNIVTGVSMQGIFQRNDGRIYVADSGLRAYEPTGDIDGNAIQVGGTLTGGPAVAYDDVTDTYLSGSGSTIVRRDFTGALIETLAIDLTGITIDHIGLNTDEDILMVTYGGSGLKYFNYSTLVAIKTEPLTGRNIDIEGAALVRSHYDNSLYIFVSSDNWFHSDGNPDTDINAIHKVISTVFTP